MLLLDLLALSATLAQAPATTPVPPRDDAATARAALAAQPPTIDGRNDDAVWALAAPTREFRQFDPHPDAEPTFRTEFQVAYDARNLYVFVRAFDPHPDSIMRALTRRDVRGPSDQIKIIIDSYHDRRSGYEFAVNPAGVKRDFAVSNDDQEDSSWNGVWDVAVAVDSLGWTAEFRIPLSQLRFAAAPSHTFGFGVWRDIERLAERVAWPLFSITRNGLASQLGRLEGLTGIGAGNRLELTPYAVTRNVSRQVAGRYEHVQQLSAGADLKYGVTPNITLDATINPDFGQVESDPAVLNLTAFETFLEERRPFFVEGTGFYRFALNCYIVVDCSTNEGLFYSRRIGRAPTLRSAYGDGRTAASTPIAAALKLTGRTPGGFSFGVLDALTEAVSGPEGRTVEPRTNYAVLRAQQDLRGGEAGISWIGTAVVRALDAWTEPVLHRNAYVTGLSARNRFGGGQYEVAGSITASRVAGTEAAILRTQRSSVHYYQQPGDGPAVDSTRTAIAGHAVQVKLGKYGGGITRFETSFVRQSAGFEPNDLGFLRRADIQDWSTWAALSFFTPRKLYRWFRVNGNHWQTWNTSGLRLENAVNLNAHIGLHNNWNLHAGATLGQLGSSYCDRCTRGGPPVRTSRTVYPWFGVNGDSRGRLVPSLWVNLGYTDAGHSRSASLSPSLTLRLSPRLEAGLAANISHTDDDNQWYGNFGDEVSGGTHYAFARLDQRTVSLTARVNYVVSPELSFEFYGQPYVSSGTWSDVREVTATPDAARYADRYQIFVPPAGSPEAFHFARLRSNAVLRWEYRPGSTLFLVWAHGREADANERSHAGWLREYRDLLDEHPDNTFLLKVAYWLNR
ncbi:MAG TPA: DUF5916 domain-containing protein [Longimicrobiales bacterium]|nr:DUF5916 domain-containing protein [Longimicrobiales bacterium]